MKKLALVLVTISMMFLVGADCDSPANKKDGKKGSYCENKDECNEGLTCWGLTKRCEDFKKLRRK